MDDFEGNSGFETNTNVQGATRDESQNDYYGFEETDMDNFEPIGAVQSQTGDLPMIVWLRGDEPYVDQFCMDADAAMAALGIKRSRLTQISGRELRVGRIRVDRYIRPVYRQEDVENYKKWSRATVTHQRASSVIQEAANSLEQHSVELAQTLSLKVDEYRGTIERLVGEIKDHLTVTQSQLQSNSEHLAGDIKDSFLTLGSTHQEHLNRRLDEFSEFFSNMAADVKVAASMESALAELKAGIALLCESFESLSSASTINAQRIEETQQAQTGYNRDIGKAISLIVQFQREASRKQDEMWSYLKNSFTGGVNVSTRRNRSIKKRPRY